MNNELFLRIIAAALFLTILAVRKIYEQQSQQVAEDGLQQDLDDKRLIGLQSALLTLSLLGLLTYIFAPRFIAWSQLSLPLWLRWLGALTALSGTVLLVWSHRVLGRNFFGGLKLRDEHVLVQEGPYRRIRHPIYTAFLAIGLGWFLQTGSWFIGGAWLLSSVIVLATRMPREEQMLIAAFGAEYEAYRARSGRFLPRLFPPSK